MSNTDKPNPTEADLAKLGIERVSGFTYHVGGFRYSNAADAMAAARRANGQ